MDIGEKEQIMLYWKIKCNTYFGTKKILIKLNKNILIFDFEWFKTFNKIYLAVLHHKHKQ